MLLRIEQQPRTLCAVGAVTLGAGEKSLPGLALRPVLGHHGKRVPVGALDPRVFHGLDPS